MSRNYVFLTSNQLKIMLKIYNEKVITFETQQIYNNKQWFKKEMQKLINFKKVMKVNTINIDMRIHNEKYVLTLLGKIFVEIAVVDFNEKNKCR